MLPVDSLPKVTCGQGFDLLSGVRVLDLTTSVAGPYATMLLADLGADLIKVERPGHGDDTRHWGPPFLNGQSLWFLSVNRNKRSLGLDIATPEGLAVVHQLAAHCDVIVCNQTITAQRKLGVDARSLRAVNAGIIHVSLTGFGTSGERADWACYDLIAEGYSGVMDLTGEPDGAPQKVGAPAADLLAGMDAALAAVAALLDRQRTGRGHDIDISLVESMTRFLTPRIVPYLGSGEVFRRSGGRDSVIAIYQTFDTADDPITLGLGNDNIWRRFWEALGRPEGAADPSRASNSQRRALRPQIVAEIQDILIARPRREWLELFAKARVPAGPINRVDEVTADENLRNRGLFYAIADEDQLVPQVGSGFHVDGTANIPRRPPPRLGEHTEDVLREFLGYGSDELADLRAKKVI